jgi:hypothetical protein
MDQGYDGASNMYVEWNRLRAKFMEECPYAYYVNCFTHELQLPLFSAAEQVHDVQIFCYHLALVVITLCLLVREMISCMLI